MWRFLVIERTDSGATLLSPLYVGRSAITAYLKRTVWYKQNTIVRAINIDNPAEFFDTSYQDWIDHQGNYGRIRQ